MQRRGGDTDNNSNNNPGMLDVRGAARRAWRVMVLWSRWLGLLLAGPYCRVPGCGVLTADHGTPGAQL